MKYKNLQKGGADIFVIILGVIIALLMFGYFRGQKIPLSLFSFGQNQTTQKTQQSGLNSKSQFTSCGLTINSPMQWEIVENVIQFSGSANGCGWNYQNGFIGTFELFDAKTAKSLTDKISIPSSNSGQFQVSIGLKRPADSSVGYIVFENLNASQNITYNVYFKK